MAVVTINFSTPFRRFMRGESKLTIEADTLSSLLRQIVNDNADIAPRIFLPDGTLQPFVGLYLNHRKIDFSNDENYLLSNNDVLDVLTAVAGG